jgi:Flp pilus assembly protein TadD
MRWSTLCVLAVIAGKAGAASTWSRVSSPSIELYTDSGDHTARAVLRRFETLHRIFRQSYDVDRAPPLRVFVFSSTGDFQKFRSAPAADAFYRGSQDRDLIVLQEVASLDRAAAHEYLHLVAHHATAPLPNWLDEGVAEFYSTLTTDATKVHIGAPIAAHLRLLAVQPWLSAEDLAHAKTAGQKIFYAESWALVHMLTLAPKWRGGMPKFANLLANGKDPDQAFPAAFGKTMDEAVAALPLYLRAPPEITAPLPPVDSAETYEVTRLSDVDATVTLADLAVQTDHPDIARSLYRKAARANPASPSAVAGLGSLALLEHREEDARNQFEQSIALGSPDAGAYFELAMLNNDSALLEKALAIDPNFVTAHFLLGVRATDNGRFADAIEHLRQAVALEPRRFTYWHALGYAQAKSGDRQGAAESARRAAILAVTEPEQQMAGALTQLASETPAVPRKKPAVITPPSWQNRQGDHRAEGFLTFVDCDHSPVRLVLSTPATLELNVQNPNQVELVNAEGASTTLVCGEQSRPVAVEYVGASSAITRIEFQQVIMKR